MASISARCALLVALLALLLTGCGGDDGGGDGGGGNAKDSSAVTKSAGDEKILRTAVQNYKRDTTRLIAAVRSGLNQGDYDNDLNDSVYELRGAIYGFDQALRRVEFDPSVEGSVVEILENDVVAIARLDSIIEAKRWPADTEARVKKVLGEIERTKATVDGLLGQL